VTDTERPDDIDEPEDSPVEEGGHTLEISVLPQDLAQGGGDRLDKTLSALLPDLSRGRLQALMAEGALSLDGKVLTNPSAKAQPGLYHLRVPAPAAAEPLAQDIPLTILFEDEHLIVLDKAAGMAVHPGPGIPDGTLVNALLHHCAGSLSGIGGVARPGIVHRLDKDTSGVMVAAKTDAAHAGLSALFAAHDLERQYIALTRGAPETSQGVIRTRIGRSQHDRKKMAVLRSGGREAVTRYRVQRVYGPQIKPLAGRVACTLETGRTHQIRVHMASKGSPCLGDPVYGSGPPAEVVREAIAASGLKRQALHAAVLGFHHPITGEPLRFETPLPADMQTLEGLLAAL
jgi:23S rRNA pseudouridine1911/1915/1917 synthase